MKTICINHTTCFSHTRAGMTVKGILILITLILSGCAELKSPDVAKMMETLQANFRPIEMMIVGTAYVAGFGLLFSAIHKLRAYGEVRTMMPSNAQMTGPLIQFFIGIALIFLPSVIKVSVTSLWGTDSLLAWPGETGDWDKIMGAVFGIVRILGYIALVRGLFLMSRAAQQGAQQGTFGKGMVHFFGGILAINIWGTVKVITASFGVFLTK
jgi:intracellular multiplication protein IcmC